MNEIIFLIEEAAEGGFTARALGESIFTEADTLHALRQQVRDAVNCHFDEGKAPKVIRLHFVRDEVLAGWVPVDIGPVGKMKLPRDVSGADLAKRLGRLGYEVTRQTGSHLRLTTRERGQHHVTIPNHDPLRVGTLAGILGDVAARFEISRDELIQRLFDWNDCLRKGLAGLARRNLGEGGEDIPANGPGSCWRRSDLIEDSIAVAAATAATELQATRLPLQH
jgi:predicted RNA binding protein YcfA (HicA-like mRNA interferase family)